MYLESVLTARCDLRTGLNDFIHRLETEGELKVVVRPPADFLVNSLDDAVGLLVYSGVLDFKGSDSG